MGYMGVVMGFLFSHKDLKKDMLSGKALALLSEFALIWHAQAGELIDLDSDDVVLRVFENSKRSKDRRLRAIYLHLRAEFSNQLQRSLPDCNPMLVDHMILHILKGGSYKMRGEQVFNRRN
jgi:hypothetical protein